MSCGPHVGPAALSRTHILVRWDPHRIRVGPTWVPHPIWWDPCGTRTYLSGTHILLGGTHVGPAYI